MLTCCKEKVFEFQRLVAGLILGPPFRRRPESIEALAEFRPSPE
jgi:hypothetical protein